MPLSKQMQQVATDLIKQFGSTITLKKPSSSTYDIASGTTIVVDGTQTQHFSNIESYLSEEIKGLIQVGDIKMMLDSSVTVDISNDKIVFKNVEYNIINIEPIYMQDEVIINNLQVRK